MPSPAVCNLPSILASTFGTSLLPFYLARVKCHHLLHEARGCEDLKQLHDKSSRVCKISRNSAFAIFVILQDNIPNEIQVSEVKKGRFCWRQLKSVLYALPRPWLQLKLLKIHSNCRKVISVIDD